MSTVTNLKALVSIKQGLFFYIVHVNIDVKNTGTASLYWLSKNKAVKYKYTNIGNEDTITCLCSSIPFYGICIYIFLVTNSYVTRKQDVH